MTKMYSKSDYEESAQYLLATTSLRPKIAVICGSGLGSFGDSLDISEGSKTPYEKIPHFPKATAPGHKGIMIIGTTQDKIPVVCMQGRFHLYEGHSIYTVALPAKVFKMMGVEVLIVTNAAGGINPNFKRGDIMIIKDHLNFPGFSGQSPLCGPNDPSVGVRFLPLNDAYDATLRQMSQTLCESLKLGEILHEGVYAMVGGPTYETPAEMRMLKILGADAIGMSTVQEIIAARHADIKCVAFSIITDLAVTDYESHEQPDEQEIIKVAKNTKSFFLEFIMKLILKIQNEFLK